MHPTPISAESNARSDSAVCADSAGAHAARELKTRAAVLRAVLEAASRLVGPDEPASELIRGSVREAERLARDARALIDWCHPDELKPMDCSAEEIGLGALRWLAPEQRARASAAVEGPLQLRALDPDVLARSIAYLMADGLAGASHASLQIVHRESGFAIVLRFEGPPPAERATDPCLGLALSIARRDLARMGLALTHVGGAAQIEPAQIESTHTERRERGAA